MPISPERMALYPGGSIKSPEWLAIRAFIRARAGDCCEECRVRNGAVGFRDVFDSWREPEGVKPGENYVQWHRAPRTYRIIRIVCTVAHVDHDVTHNHETNLRFWCQRCHLRHDAKQHAANAAITRHEKAGQPDLLGRN